jgi:uncharacterized RDD family membrane protein YckC
MGTPDESASPRGVTEAADVSAEPSAPLETRATRSAPSIMRRVAVLPYEGLLLLAFVLIISFPIAGLKGLTLEGIPHFVYQAYLFLIVGLFYTWFWRRSGQTLPMKTWRMRITDRNGKLITRARAWARYVSAMLFYGPPCVGILLIFFPQRISPIITMWCFLPMVATILAARFDGDKQFLHDRLAGTRIEDISDARP